MVKIAIIEDDTVLIDALARFINGQANFLCVLQANSLDCFFEILTPNVTIDIVLLDISLGELNSLEYLGKIKRLIPNCKIIIMTGHESTDFVIQAMQEGADSYYLKRSSPTQLINTILATKEGAGVLDPNVVTGLAKIFQKEEFPAPSNIFPAERIKKHWQLSRRELEVAEGLFFEKAYKEIAEANNISIDTVRFHLKSLYKKMDVHNRSELTRKMMNINTP